MTRKAILLSLLGLISAVAFLSTILALSPIWVTIFMIRPRFASGLRDIIQAKIMREVGKMMFGSRKIKV